MAGDWIKVEKASPHKPEVLLMARRLGVTRQHAFGVLVEFWMWLDSNCVDGVVDGVVDADVDALVACVGFSSLLRAVGWAKFETDPPRLLITNWDRHNGETSKNRALRNERQARWRAKSVDADVDASPSTREEKRREERKTTFAPNAIAFDADAGFTGIGEEDLQLWSAAYPALDLKAEINAAAAWARANPKNAKSNWRRYLTNWLKRSQDRAPRVARTVDGPRRVAA